MFQGREKKGFYFESLSSESDERRRRGSVFDFDPGPTGCETMRMSAGTPVRIAVIRKR
jgi:hypothetical protein